MNEGLSGHRQPRMSLHRRDEALPRTHSLAAQRSDVVVSDTDHLLGIEIVDPFVAEG